MFAFVLALRVPTAAADVPLDRDPDQSDHPQLALGRRRLRRARAGSSNTATLQGLLGYHSNGAIVTWLPLFLFAVLFGLSMDYHVFILSRVKELVDQGMPTDKAVANGHPARPRRPSPAPPP